MPVQRSGKRSATRCITHDRSCPVGGATAAQWLARCERLGTMAEAIVGKPMPAAEMAVDEQRSCRPATEQDRRGRLGIFADPNPQWIDPAVLALAEEIEARDPETDQPRHNHSTITATPLGVRSYGDGCPIPDSPKPVEEPEKGSQGDGDAAEKPKPRRRAKASLTVLRY